MGTLSNAGKLHPCVSVNRIRCACCLLPQCCRDFPFLFLAGIRPWIHRCGFDRDEIWHLELMGAEGCGTTDQGCCECL